MLSVFALTAILSTQEPSIVAKSVLYLDGPTRCEGYVAYPKDTKKPRPVVLVVQDWNGIDEYEQRRCREFAELGYIAFAVDVYGGVRPKNAQENAAESGKYYRDPELFMGRLRAGMKVATGSLVSPAKPNRAKVAAIGYCFGGKAVLEMVRSGFDLKGVVSFHGGLGTNNPATPGKSKSRVLVCHGDADPLVPPKEVEAFKTEMSGANIPLKFVGYPGAVHAFTVPGPTKSGPAVYSEVADKASWEEMKTFLSDLFK